MEADLIDFSSITAESLIQQNGYEYSLSKINKLPEEFIVPLFSEWAKENRYIPEGISDFHGMFDPGIAPQWIEPLNMLHPDNPIRIVSIIKSDQAMCTTSVAENAIGAFIRYQLGSILYLTSTKGMGQIRGSANIDTMIDWSGLADYIRPMSSRNSRKIKDNALYKELAGNSILLVTSYNSSADMKSNKFNLIIKDELDEAGVEINGLGDVEKVIDTRTFGTAFWKILNISTASRAETSRIHKNFLKGDQREYECKCPHCGKHQLLEIKKSGQEHGLTFLREKDKKTGKKVLIIESVGYICIECGKVLKESDKPYMIQNGIWVPRATPSDPHHASFRSPGMISQALPWTRICQQFIDSDFGKDVVVFKNFTINVLAKAWLSVKKTAKWEQLKARAENYSLGTVPQGKVQQIEGWNVYVGGPLVFFGGVDVHKTRLELCVVGFGYNGEKWIVDQQFFYGVTKNADDPCWASLSNYVYTKAYIVQGNETLITMCAVDSGYDPRKSDKRDKDFNDKAHMVYEFVANHQRYDVNRFIAVMGNPDEKSIGVLKESRISDTKTTLTKRYMVAVSLLKDMIYNVIEQEEGYNTIHVPATQVIDGHEVSIPDEFYMQILSERYQENPKKPGKYGWFPIRHDNHLLDELIYSIAAAYYKNLPRWSISYWSELYYAIVSPQ